MKSHVRSLMRLVSAGALLTLGVVVAGAQDAVDPALLSPVQVAFENTRAVDSLHIETQALTESSGGFGEMQIQSATSFDLVRAGEDWNAAGRMRTTSTLPFGEIVLNSEVVRVDGTTHVRFSDVPQDVPVALPQDWVTTDDLAAQAGGNAGTPGLASGVDVASLLGSLNLPLSAESVTAISALPDDAIDGQAMRVFQLSLDPALVLESDAAGLLSAASGPGMGAGGFPGAGQLPADATPPAGMQPPAEMPSDVTAPAPEDVQVTLAAYVGADDGLIHRIYLVVNIAASADGSRPLTTITTISDYSAFDEPVEITAPVQS